MGSNGRKNGRMNGKLAFMREFFRHPMEIASIIPSSRFLERRIVEAAGVNSAEVVVELGPGTGGTTMAILRAMAPSARLLSIEINPHFHSLVSGIGDDRLIPHLGSASDLHEILSDYGLNAPNAVISGIPFSTMHPAVGTRILQAVSASLAPNGRFVAYQARDRVASLCRPLMGTGRSVMELFNIPPMRIYQWEKERI